MPLQDLFALGGGSPLTVFWFLLSQGGWMIILPIMIWAFGWGYLEILQNGFNARLTKTLLAIDVPKDNEQSFRAIEQIFAQIAGAHDDPDFTEKYLDGRFQEYFSLEIVSVEGYIQFLIWTPKKFQDLIEAAFYAQYPDAEITEVEDYVDDVPKEIPNEDYELYGGEFVPTNRQYYSIRTYPQFEDKLTGVAVDPMAGLLEVMSKIGPGEQVWLQLVITPVGDEWKEQAKRLALKIAGKKVKVSYNLIEKAVYGSLKTVSYMGEQTLGTGVSVPEEKADDKPPSILLHLTPGELNQIKSLEEKAAKIAFKTRFRFVYIARREVYSKPRVISPLVGAVKQFNTQDLGGLKVDKLTKTKAKYFFIKRRNLARKHRILRAYRSRTSWVGARTGNCILNIEELASIYHFPLITVKTASVTRVETKKYEPPRKLPILPREILKQEAALADNPLGNEAMREVFLRSPEETQHNEAPELSTQTVTEVQIPRTPKSSVVDAGHIKNTPPTNLPIG
ncbi:MAG: hypothetical protein A3B74_04805 [Candidatus Kerfeldbacteria bacterium RIFCSPHIGHO2_02_FULL_42_14]|uniref:DUF8128 domain-containing protein n=1 Tax=Candidatus Kerfeldbacteria bacterium RIFCSPHIGHO2_02_FULL_42_14 TaxID=1798540 RepID=A0A1G2AP14_9BACT|nr:MAG: hypothetical protein A3B74_04805 [Candidatus Kerfeldbacteria bacterium RIFCSPHIGHO2_02_FULL_42_14]OGY81040.1 MAG: hypothetical protein A3E60_03525 [Candidatus Kerfeldbacteria bacterium RIFCSPHIGHO2_12_FULL_42_13]OGY84858.1 MAG: hypothetical protein A3I91_05170 [Candidatus Kerfeldbacteria bacterium RIFCSPLOWO2_02_FULL_42_19]OGY86771.1 MAG: hypothetical protein A3G01_02470 [Candidatus Kerfeldbacteria bacterium RIFCSPLOWO2_12_FULL_43_9]